MKKFFKTFIALATALVMTAGTLALTACNTNESEPEESTGIAGTYTYDYISGMGDEETAQMVLTSDNGAEFSVPGNAIFGSEIYLGTYTYSQTANSDGTYTVSVSGLYCSTALDGAGAYPALWGTWIDSETGDCTIYVNTTDKTFTPEITGDEKVTVSGSYTYTEGGVTYEIELSLDGSCGITEDGSTWFEGSYEMNGTSVTITLNSDYTGSASFIVGKTFQITINDDETFTPIVEEELTLDGTLSVGTYSIDVTNALGIDETYELALSDGSCTFTMTNTFLSCSFSGTYTNDGGKLTISGLRNEDDVLADEFTMLTGDTPFADYFSNGGGYANVYTNGTWAITDADGEVLLGGSASTGGGSSSIADEWGTDDGNTVYDGVAYVTDGSEAQTFDLYVPAEASATNKLPLLVVIHGGAFAMGDSKMAIIQPVYQYFRDQGYVVASLNYRLSSEAASPAAMVDCKTALQWLYDNADTYYIDNTNITVMGESAGAYLAIMTSLSGASAYKAETQTADYTFDVTNLIDFYGPTQPENSNPYITTSAASLLDGDFNTDLNIWIQHGDSDGTVNYSHSQVLVAALEECESYTGKLIYEWVAGADHMDSAFYTDDNLAAVKAWLTGEEAAGEEVAGKEVLGAYTYSEEKEIMGNLATDVNKVVLYSDGTCTLNVEGGAFGAMAAVHTGAWYQSNGVVVIYGLTYDNNGTETVTPGKEENMLNFSFIANGSCAIVPDETEGTFVPLDVYGCVEEGTNPFTGQATEDLWLVALDEDGKCYVTAPGTSSATFSEIVFVGTYTEKDGVVALSEVKNGDTVIDGTDSSAIGLKCPFVTGGSGDITLGTDGSFTFGATE